LQAESASPIRINAAHLVVLTKSRPPCRDVIRRKC
jgi:hypothetical protein